MTKQEFLKALWTKLSELPKDDVEQSLDYYAEMIEDRIESGLSEEEAVAAVGTVDEAAAKIISEVPKPRSSGNKSTIASFNTEQMASAPAEDTPVQPTPQAEPKPNTGYTQPKSSVGTGRLHGAEYNEAYNEYINQALNHTEEKPQQKQTSSGGGGWKWAFLILGFPIWFPIFVTLASLTFAAFVTIWALTFAMYAVAGSFVAAGVGGVVSIIALAISGNVALGLVYLGAGLFLAGLGIFIFLISTSVVKGSFRLSGALWRGVTRIFRGRRAAE